jgi:hypothetical protein
MGGAPGRVIRVIRVIHKGFPYKRQPLSQSYPCNGSFLTHVDYVYRVRHFANLQR